MKYKAILTVLFMLGCQGNQGPAGPPGPQGAPGLAGAAATPPVFGADVAGTRLRPYELVAEDGTRVLVPEIWYDTEREEACAFRAPVFGDPMRCLPDALSRKPGWYADASCAEPIDVIDKCTSPARYVQEGKQDGCYPTLVAIRAVLEPLPDGAQLFYKASEMAACAPQGVNMPSPFLLTVRVSDPIPWDAFVAAEIKPVE